MDYEKLYKEALKKARIYREHLIKTGDNYNEIEYIFPELKKSDDERIRKTLKSFFDSEISDYGNVEWRNGIMYGEIVTWLEKQSEQNKKYLDIIINLWDLLDKIDTYADLKINNTNPNNPFRKIEHITQKRHKFVKSDGYNLFIDDKQITNQTYTKHDTIKPKFNVGDCITDGEYTWKVISIERLDYILQSQNGDTIDNTISYVDEHFHLWTIQDAKNGDVLGWDNSKCIALFKNIYSINYFYSYGCVGHLTGIFESFKSGPSYHSTEYVHPATKEQRDILFQKMSEAGYTWDAETKQLIKKQS